MTETCLWQANMQVKKHSTQNEEWIYTYVYIYNYMYNFAFELFYIPYEIKVHL